MRTVRGIDVTPDSVSIDAMKEVCLGGPGHYLGSDQTRALMQTEYVYPAIGNRMSPKEWVEADRPILIEKAIERKNQILASAGNMFDPDIDATIRKNYNIYFN
jgi:trimethylamine--corrinoid protein Co-methyltransferase